jgi:DNA-binding NarL/FixJ family response regulator
VLLVDDHQGTRSILLSVLTHERFDVCGEAQNGYEAIDKAAELRPDVVVIDLLMPRLNGIETAPRIRCVVPHVKIILISGYLPPKLGSAAARLAGAQAYVEKHTAIRDLGPAIRAVL